MGIQNKKNNITKEQIKAQIALQERSKKFKSIARKLFPILQKETTSIVHAQQVCEIFKTVIIAAMNKHWDGKTLKDLGLKEELTTEKDVQDRDLHEAIIDLLSDETLGDAQQLLQGMAQTLNAHANKLAEKISLKDVRDTDIIND